MDFTFWSLKMLVIAFGPLKKSISNSMTCHLMTLYQLLCTSVLDDEPTIRLNEICF